MTLKNQPSFVSEEVREAVKDGRAVVALESTIFTHGLPRPRNLQVALEAEDQLRQADVTPATVGVVDGTFTVGLSRSAIERLSRDDNAVKLSIRDLPVAAVQGLNGGTTVAATALLAHRAGIQVFATGGLGGVHRDAQHTFDESADLVALANTPILVVSAGVKSILDIGATLERLETLNVTVVGWRTTHYPGFYVTDSGYTIEQSISTATEAAELIAQRDALGLRSAVLVANPVAENKQLDPALHSRLLGDAIEEARNQGIRGQGMTPFLLDHIQRGTGGASLKVNVEVYKGNVALGGAIAKALTSREATHAGHPG